MMHPRHGVEQVREMRRAPFQRGDGVAVIGSGVPDREDDLLAEMFDQSADAFDLGRDGDDESQMWRFVDERADLLDVGRTDRFDALRAGSFGADVWAFQMDRADLRRL